VRRNEGVIPFWRLELATAELARKFRPEAYRKDFYRPAMIQLSWLGTTGLRAQ
jgi:hypothetical protein